MTRPVSRWPAHAGTAVALLLAAVAAHAEAPQQTSSPTVPPLAYTPAFATYQRFADQPITPWREANDTVGRIGGWRGYAKEASEETPSTAPAATAPVLPPHGGGHEAHTGAQP
ncbi:hypothetical protein ACM74C_23920 [Pseudomonas aeruginosa]|uniref:hypothetical protein n=1 Tax=Gammaproteobacteria TaxID=1236 RepID=UPI0008DE040E|nr:MULTISPECIES: hypothetical protein [Pseudomonas]MPS43512.1 hypothetical protein [Stenotrophomonas sp.]ELQ8103790.1 hypothetical protein [Pseudomonas aeruginosa]ELZ4494574.1 hypothetical protein [Pseudomonas aeruginosa]MBG7041169.1 hypothetical protein [Pseudomonas aeruginosa]MBH3548367.1 hypothetical protein [Pseudomonas aeruginosa]